MREHTTHHDDCGCKSETYEARITELEAQLAKVDCRECAIKIVKCHDVVDAIEDRLVQIEMALNGDSFLCLRDTVDPLARRVKDVVGELRAEKCTSANLQAQVNYLADRAAIYCQQDDCCTKQRGNLNLDPDVCRQCYIDRAIESVKKGIT